MANRSEATTIDSYIAEFPPETAAILQSIRELIHSIAPDAVETISYAIPTFDLRGKHLVHFAGFAKHIGFYPTGSGMDAFADEVAGYKHARGSVQFPLDEPMPMDLIRRMTEHRVAQVERG